jgi:CRP-like cAMP-binding protein
VGLADASSDFLAGLDAGDTEALAALGARRRVAAGATLLREGHRSETVALVQRGRLKISYMSVDGREVILAIVGPGSVLGEVAAIDGEPHSSSAIALEPVEVAIIPAARFRAFVAERPSVGMALLRTLTRRLRDSDRRQVEFATTDTVGRVSACLIDLADRYGDGDDMGIRLSQDELASLTGASREAVVKALATLRSRGWIETARRSIRIIEREALVNRRVAP